MTARERLRVLVSPHSETNHSLVVTNIYKRHSPPSGIGDINENQTNKNQEAHTDKDGRHTRVMLSFHGRNSHKGGGVFMKDNRLLFFVWSLPKYGKAYHIRKQTIRAVALVACLVTPATNWLYPLIHWRVKDIIIRCDR